VIGVPQVQRVGLRSQTVGTGTQGHSSDHFLVMEEPKRFNARLGLIVAETSDTF